MNSNSSESGSDTEVFPEDAPGFEMPLYLHKPPRGSRELDEMILDGIIGRVAWLESHGLRPSANILKRRDELIELLKMQENEVIPAKQS
jgi:hypothetical protein